MSAPTDEGEGQSLERVPRALFDRIADIHRGGETLQPVRSAFIYGVEEFPIEFRPRDDAQSPAR